MSDRCGAHARTTGKPCRKYAGQGTDHPGVGRCSNHGGASPIVHGQRSAIPARYRLQRQEELGQLFEEYDADPDPLNLYPELAAMRALFVDYIERYDRWRDALLAWHESFRLGDGQGKPREILDIADATRIADRIGKMVERIEKIRSENAISRPALLNLLNGMALVVRQNVTDEATIDAIADGWQALTVMTTTTPRGEPV